MRRFSGRAIAWCAILIVAVSAHAFAGQGLVSIQKVGGLISGTSVAAGANVRFLIRYTNNTGEKCDIATGFKLSSPDGATWDSTTIDSVGPFPGGAATYFIPFFDIVFSMSRASCDGQGEDTVGVFASGKQSKAGAQLPATWNDSVFAITAWFDGKKTAAGKHICIDSSFFQPGGTWSWVGKSITIYTPEFQGLTPSQSYSDGNAGTRLGSGYCFSIYAPTLTVTPSQLDFTCTANGTPPANQTFAVTSNGDSLSDFQNFTLTENSPWIQKSPTSGTTPKTVTVSINQTGYPNGDYLDSIQVSSATSVNSPQWLRVGMHVTTPPPSLYVSKALLNFVGVTGGANPAPQTFIVKNTGGSVLHWTLSADSSWLVYSPASGTDSGMVTVSPNIAGMSTGTHTDTLVVTDPLAINSPRKIIVNVTLGSNLPFIVADSAVNHFVVDLSTHPTLPPCVVHLTNGGIGTLSFTLTKSSNRLFDVTPLSGTTPQDVTVSFKILADVAGTTKIDTLWVTSPEATNSPYPVIFYFHFTNTPAILTTNRDTISLTTYQCWQGLNGPLPKDSFRVDNSGGDNPIDVGLVYHTTYATVSVDSGNPPFDVVLQAKDIDLPPGTYYDTLLITAIDAINSPVRVILKYNRSVGTHQPEIVAKDSFVVTRQEQTGNVQLSSYIQNRYPGCMPWSVDESIPWLTAVSGSGNAGGLMTVLANVDGFTRGLYRDSFYIQAPSASNEPKKIVLRMQIWRLHGDVNWNGIIDLADLSYMVAYLTEGAPLPKPEYVVGDLNCNLFVDLADLSYLVAILKSNGPPPCGNP
jgi:hypothetical protein